MTKVSCPVLSRKDDLKHFDNDYRDANSLIADTGSRTILINLAALRLVLWLRFWKSALSFHPSSSVG